MTAPFQMVGDPTAAACVGDVCEIPQAAAAESAPDQSRSDQSRSDQSRSDQSRSDQPRPDQPHPEQSPPEQPVRPSEQAVVNQRLDEDLV